ARRVYESSPGRWAYAIEAPSATLLATARRDSNRLSIANVVADPADKGARDGQPHQRHDRRLGVELPHHRVDAGQDDDGNLQQRITHDVSPDRSCGSSWHDLRSLESLWRVGYTLGLSLLLHSNQTPSDSAVAIALPKCPASAR